VSFERILNLPLDELPQREVPGIEKAKGDVIRLTKLPDFGVRAAAYPASSAPRSVGR
jgi:hypothetical protein